MRIAGRNARLYAAIASGGSASPIPYINSFSINGSSDRYDVTAFGDTNKVEVAGLPGASGTWAGFYDTATNQLYDASQDGVARPTYMYPDIVNTPGTYWFTTAFFDYSSEFSATAGASISGSWSAGSSLVKVSA